MDDFIGYAVVILVFAGVPAWALLCYGTPVAGWKICVRTLRALLQADRAKWAVPWGIAVLLVILLFVYPLAAGAFVIALYLIGLIAGVKALIRSAWFLRFKVIGLLATLGALILVFLPDGGQGAGLLAMAWLGIWTLLGIVALKLAPDAQRQDVLSWLRNAYKLRFFGGNYRGSKGDPTP